jgi:peptidoglycan/xylan/chitin deacetylase (PgdA/CDA1 family)
VEPITERRRTVAWSVRSRMSPRLRPVVRRAVDQLLAPVLGSWHASSDITSVGLTLDDGPDPEVTPALIDRLAELEVTATFFLLTLRAEQHPKLVERLIASGHEVALHGLDHRRVAGMSLGDAEGYLRDARTRLEQVAARAVTLFRPPYGAQSIASLRAARHAGLQVVVWNADAADWVDRSAADVAGAALEACRPGGILLFHERLEPDPSNPDPRRGAPVTTFDRVQVVGDIVQGLRARSLAPRAVRELAADSRMQRTVWLRP